MNKHIGFVQTQEPNNSFDVRLQAAVAKKRGELKRMMAIPEPKFKSVMATPGVVLTIG